MRTQDIGARDYAFDAETTEKLAVLTRLMLDYNKRINLTRITVPEEILAKHYKDSAIPLELLRENDIVPRGTSAKVIDVGSGAGFPGLVWGLLEQNLFDLTLLDSQKNRVIYLEQAINTLKLERTKALHGRAEQLGTDTIYRERFDVAAARAVANLSALCEYCLPFLKIGGVFAAMKGVYKEEEIAASTNALALLGGEIERIFRYTLPAGDERTLIVIRKKASINKKYPRQRVSITKNPL